MKSCIFSKVMSIYNTWGCPHKICTHQKLVCVVYKGFRFQLYCFSSLYMPSGSFLFGTETDISHAFKTENVSLELCFPFVGNKKWNGQWIMVKSLILPNLSTRLQIDIFLNICEAGKQVVITIYAII